MNQFHNTKIEFSRRFIDDKLVENNYIVVPALRKPFMHLTQIDSELVQLDLNVETSVGDSTPTEAEYEGSLPLIEVGVLQLNKKGFGKTPRNLFYHLFLKIANVIYLRLNSNPRDCHLKSSFAWF